MQKNFLKSLNVERTQMDYFVIQKSKCVDSHIAKFGDLSKMARRNSMVILKQPPTCMAIVKPPTASTKLPDNEQTRVNETMKISEENGDISESGFSIVTQIM